MEDSTALEEPGVDEAEATEEPASVVAAADVEADEESEENAEQEEEIEIDEEDEEPEAVAEFDEIDFGGDKFNVPKGALPDELKDRITGAWKNYSEKSSAIAEQSKQLEMRQRVVEKLESLNDEALGHFARGKALQSDIARLNDALTDELWQSDPTGATRISAEITRKTNELNATVQQVNAAEMAIVQAKEQEKARMVEQEKTAMKAGKAEMDKRIPGFSTKHAKEVVDYAVSKGMPKEMAERWPLDPFATETIYYAMKYQKALAKSKGKQKSGVEPAKVPTSSRKGKGGTGQRDPEKMTMEEYVTYRENGGG